MSGKRSIVLLVSITGIVCLGIGYFAGTITDQIQNGRASQLAAIRIEVDNLAALNHSSSGFERTTRLSARADLLTFVCERYERLNVKQGIETRSYVTKYNSLVGGNYALPPIGDGADKEQTRLQYCGLLKSKPI